MDPDRFIKRNRKEWLLQVRATTSLDKQHDSFDFETSVPEKNPVLQSDHLFKLTHHFVIVLRDKTTFEVTFEERKSLEIKQQFKTKELLCVFQIKYVDRKIFLGFFESEDVLPAQRGRKYQQDYQQNHIYVVVRSLKNFDYESTGYLLKETSMLRIGQKEYFISSVGKWNSSENQDNNSQVAMRDKILLIDRIIHKSKVLAVPDGPIKGECRYCMLEESEGFGQFLCSPCKCSGSSAMVHFNCLQKWNQVKVKVEKIAGLAHYNFEKFFCEVCKQEYPKRIKKQKKIYELMPINIPQKQHLILQQLNSKSSNLICIQDIPEQGIRIGRGDECEIRIQSPSISRNHATIRQICGDYYVFDNKSKFGTSVRDANLSFEIDSRQRGIQINRTVIMFQLVRTQKYT